MPTLASQERPRPAAPGAVERPAVVVLEVAVAVVVAPDRRARLLSEGDRQP